MYDLQFQILDHAHIFEYKTESVISLMIFFCDAKWLFKKKVI